MKGYQIAFSCTLLFGFLMPIEGHGAEKSYGIVNFLHCMKESKYGKREKEKFDRLEEHMISLITDHDKQYNDVMSRLSDPEFVDSLSPEGEQELRSRVQTVGEELSRYREQYAQVMQRANMQYVQMLSQHVQQAAAVVAKTRSLQMREKMPAFSMIQHMRLPTA